MENCLVTKLNATVSNDNLSKLGTIRMTLHAVQNPTVDMQLLYIDMASDAEISSLKVVSGNATILTTVPSDWSDNTGGVTEISLIPGGVYRCFLTNYDCVLEISNKYGVVYFQSGSNISLNLDELWLPKISEIDCVLAKGTANIIKDAWPNSLKRVSISHLTVEYLRQDIPFALVGKDIEEINLPNNQTDGLSLDELLSGCTNLKYLGCAGSYISGNISYFLVDGQLRFPNFNTLHISNTPNIIKSSEDVATLRSLGVTITGV